MDQLEHYRHTILSVLRDTAELLSNEVDVEIVVLTDREQDHYQLLRIGWEQDQRVFDTPIHIRIRDGKVWIEHNTLPQRIGEQLTSAGVPREHIVLGFQPQVLRHLTNFAAA